MKQLPLFQFEKEPLPTDLEALKRKAVFLVTYSGGKDSTAQVLHLLEEGIPKNRIILHHHDVDGHGNNEWDWPCTPSYCEAFARALDIPLLFSYREGGIAREIDREDEGLQDVLYQREPGGEFYRLASRPGSSVRKKFPAVVADLRTRWCSSVVKIDVLSRVVANHPDYSHGTFVICTGERRQESAGRAKYLEMELYRSNSKQRRAWQWRPIIDWTEDEVWDIMNRWKIQPHPAYELGWGRCSCATCIFSSPSTWASLYELDPVRVKTFFATEKRLGHTLYHGKNGPITLEDWVARGKSFIDPAMKERWASEALSQFVSPIFVDDWKLPQGAFSHEISGSV